MRFSTFFAPTLKETPKDVVLKSHEYLLRAGYIQQLGSGIYSFLPLGKRVLTRISQIVREEMNRIHAQEVMLGFVTPSELWEKSNRLHKYGKELLRFKDRKNAEFVLGPTHEEAAVEMIKGYIKSHKQLPIHIYQIHLKFRDEMRPRSGLMRGREFIMKDAYSFHKNKADLVREFQVMEQCYQRIFNRLGLDFRIVKADSGSIGGTGSKEFMVVAESGEDTLAICQECTYAANLEAATRTAKQPQTRPPQATFAKFNTPNTTSIKSLCAFFHVEPYWTMKAVVKKILKQGKSELAYFFIRGNDTLENIKAQNVTGADEIIDASKEEIEAVGLHIGYIGPIALRNITQSQQIYFDEELRDGGNLICGANEEGYHFVGVNLAEFEGLVYADLISIQEGDICPECKRGTLIHKKGIEVGHIFQLGTRYSEPLNASFLDENAQSCFFEMGCYGIGISRLLSASVEQNHDQKGIIWTSSISPFSLTLILSNSKDSLQQQEAEKIYNSLQEMGIEVLFDDRNERFGSKMADFELMGIPFALIIGKGTPNGLCEIIQRKTQERCEIQLSEACAYVQKLIHHCSVNLSTD
ncbi:proline--tRNA ligase [Helicobacter monodelphidis]|uniref:proline--tRNA ligase n=1 Tax=Helicobacter sp. 15-1451 TaxID=2004995 RepID=UPI000DCB5105|nr:proline--tRNA ligase [Helicobacter sp. 15-1451]RAX57925.1 proline--tRNA ligase [Helicobacter sp. 15-1451]